MSEADEMDAERSTKADLKNRSTDWTDWAYTISIGHSHIPRITHIDDTSQSPDGVWTVDDLQVWLHVLHDGRCDHNDILCNSRQLLDDEIDHLTKRRLLRQLMAKASL